MNDRENYESWLRDFQNDAETAAELKAIENQPSRARTPAKTASKLSRVSRPVRQL